jgi:hypothetical protein
MTVREEVMVDGNARAHPRRVQAIQRKQHTGLLQVFVVFHPSPQRPWRPASHLTAGVERWREYREQLEPLKKKPILFLMLNDTGDRRCFGRPPMGVVRGRSNQGAEAAGRRFFHG